MRFSFIHAADLHIDSPFAGLGARDPAVAERFARAGRRAVEALVAQTVASDAAFLIIAGDVFDSDWRDISSGLFFARALGELHRAGIPTILLKGNHDAESVMSRSLTYPGSVRTFSSTGAESIVLDAHRTVLHGRSFTERRVSDGFVASYPKRRVGWFNIGVLHTALDGSRGHESYAPCSVADLRLFGYDYWALGHIHAAETVSRDPWIVYPGNLQGRNVRETGPKGAVRVTVEDGRVVEVVPIVLDAARWAHLDLDVADHDDEPAVLGLIDEALGRLHGQADGRPLAVRVTLSGTTSAHARLIAGRESIEAEARALGFGFAQDCWVEQVKIATSAPDRPKGVKTEPDSLDVPALLDAAANDPEFAAVVAELVRSIADKLPRDLRGEFGSDDPAALERLAALARDHLTGALTG